MSYCKLSEAIFDELREALKAIDDKTFHYAVNTKLQIEILDWKQYSFWKRVLEFASKFKDNSE